MELKKNIFSLCVLFFYSFIALSQQNLEPSNQKGIIRTIRQGNNWDWGTCGHGSFDDAVRLFDAEKEVSIYEEGKAKYRVFTKGNKNYVEMTCGWSGGVFTYTTNINPDIEAVESTGGIKTEQTQVSVSNDELNKVIRKNDNWSWGTYDHGSFDQAALILNEAANIKTLKDPYNTKITYRFFMHGSLNFVEVNYGWKGGIYTYTTNR